MRIDENITVDYKMAIQRVSQNMDLVEEYDAFKGSVAIAVVFGIPKEIVIDDIIEYRTSRL